MTRRISDLDDPAFTALFTGISKSWYRLEGLQYYDVSYERQEFSAFLHGEPVNREAGPWQMMIAGHVACGRELQRVHVIEIPLSSYIRYELECYSLNAEAGEDIRVIPVPCGDWPEGVPRHDYWLFDERDVWRMVYGTDGRFLYALQDNTHVSDALAWRDAALRQSVPLSAFAAPLHRAL